MDQVQKGRLRQSVSRTPLSKPYSDESRDLNLTLLLAIYPINKVLKNSAWFRLIETADGF
jgi:hypothetical protein